jgi:hypothetical protein
MNRNDIKYRLRESLTELFEEDKEENKSEKDKDSEKPLDQRDQNSIQQRLKSPLAPSMADVCKQSGIFPNATKNASQRSACAKKLQQNDGQGLNDDEKDAVEAALKIS